MDTNKIIIKNIPTYYLKTSMKTIREGKATPAKGSATIYLTQKPDEKIHYKNFFNNFDQSNNYLIDKVKTLEYMQSVKFEYMLHLAPNANEKYFEILDISVWKSKYNDILNTKNTEFFGLTVEEHIMNNPERQTLRAKGKAFDILRNSMVPNITELVVEKSYENGKYSYTFYPQLKENLNSIINSDSKYNSDEELELESELELENTNEKSYGGKNLIISGAPGTGKSFSIQKFIRDNGIEDYSDKQEHSNVFRTTLHPEFTYNDLVGQVMPVVKEDKITYEFTPQVFTNALKQAFTSEINNSLPVFLILEEMSRANVAAVFGDLFQLLDRDEKGESEYRINNSLLAEQVFKDPSKKIYLPSNLYILGTVNTSDQNVFVMDTAFKRRFEFEYISTKVSEELAKENEYLLVLGNISVRWVTFINVLNKYIVDILENDGLGLSEDKQVGLFFIKFKKKTEENSEIHSEIEKYNFNQITGKLLQYLWEDVEKASYSENKIFDEEISYFGELYEKAKNKKNIFSKAFIQRLEKEKNREN